jgi:predicted TPR repeat methyltransferase
VANFLENNSFKYDVILSLDGISYSSDLENTLALIYSSLNKGGYFAFCLQKSHSSYLSRPALQFIYNCDEVNALITKSGYTNLSAEELTMDNKRDYSIFVLLK